MGIEHCQSQKLDWDLNPRAKRRIEQDREIMLEMDISDQIMLVLLRPGIVNESKSGSRTVCKIEAEVQDDPVLVTPQKLLKFNRNLHDILILF